MSIGQFVKLADFCKSRITASIFGGPKYADPYLFSEEFVMHAGPPGVFQIRGIARAGDSALSPIQNAAGSRYASDDSENEAEVAQRACVYMFTMSHSDKEGIRKPDSIKKPELIKLLLDCYGHKDPNTITKQDNVRKWSVFQEEHATSKYRPDGAKSHYHVIIKPRAGRAWAPIVREMWNKHKIRIHCSSRHRGYHTAFSYCALSSYARQDFHGFRRVGRRKATPIFDLLDSLVRAGCLTTGERWINAMS